MKKNNYLFVLLAFIFATNCSTIKKPFLWKVSKDGNQGYILGTIHAGVALDEFPKYVLEIIDNAPAGAFELTGELEEDETALDQSFFKSHQKQLNINLKNKEKTKDKFTKEEWQEIEIRTKSKLSGKLPEYFEYYPARSLLSFVQFKNKTRVSEYEYYQLNSQMLDKAIYLKFSKKNKTRVRLDTKEIMSVDCETHVYVFLIKDFLRQSPRQVVENLSRNGDKYRTGDENQIASLRLRTEDKQVYRCLFEERNNNWAPIIQDVIANDKNAFIAAGVGHFIGEGSVLEILKKNGYNIQRVTQE